MLPVRGRLTEAHAEPLSPQISSWRETSSPYNQVLLGTCHFVLHLAIVIPPPARRVPFCLGRRGMTHAITTQPFHRKQSATG